MTQTRHEHESDMCMEGHTIPPWSRQTCQSLALPLRLCPVPASAPALEVREVRDDFLLQRNEAALRCELGQRPHIRLRADFRPAHDGVLERLHLHLPLGAPSLTHFNLPLFPVMMCTCNKVYEVRTWLRQLTRASFAVETTSSSLELFWDRVDSAGLLRVVRCDSEPAIAQNAEKQWFSDGIEPKSE